MGEDTRKAPRPLHLPRSMSSSHTLCSMVSNKNENNGENDEDYIMGKTHFQNEEYEEARRLIEKCVDNFCDAKYQLAVMYYDGLGGPKECSIAVQLMFDIVETPTSADKASLIRCAQYNIGRAYYEGIGVKQSDKEAEKWWLLSADDGEPEGCVKAQSILGMFYARFGEETFDIQKAHFWHQEATGNGSLESQGALAVMYEHGIFVKKNMETAFKCFKSASEKGNVYAMGNLAVHYYRNKMFTNACNVAKHVGSLQDTAQLSRQTNCLEAYVRKGIALGCFVYGRCLERGVAEVKELGEIGKWYSRACHFDSDVGQQMQDMVAHGKI